MPRSVQLSTTTHGTTEGGRPPYGSGNYARWPGWTTGTALRPAPFRLRTRTAGTVAVYGDGDTQFLHPDIQEQARRRTEVLRALDVVGDARTRDLVECLRRLRREEKDGAERNAPAALIVYEALAERATGKGTSGGSGEMPFSEVLRAFTTGEGLVLTNSGWRRPGECLIGEPLFGASRAFAPVFTGGEAFWTRLGARRPTVDDAVKVIRELAQQDRRERRNVPEGTTQSVVLETLKMLRRPSAVRSEELTAGRLGRLPWSRARGG